MAGCFDAFSGRNIVIGGPAVNHPSSGWTIYMMVNRSTSGIPNTFGYLWSGNIPLSFEAGVTLLVNSSNQLRIIVDTAGGNLLDVNSVATFPGDTWVGLSVSWNSSGQIQMSLDGIDESFVMASPGSFNSFRSPMIGFAHAGGFREFNGHIAHVAFYARTLSFSDSSPATAIMLCPRFLQNSLLFHVPIWNANQLFDEQQVQTVTPTSMLFINGPPATYPVGASLVPRVSAAVPRKFFNANFTFG